MTRRDLVAALFLSSTLTALAFAPGAALAMHSPRSTDDARRLAGAEVPALGTGWRPSLVGPATSSDQARLLAPAPGLVEASRQDRPGPIFSTDQARSAATR